MGFLSSDSGACFRQDLHQHLDMVSLGPTWKVHHAQSSVGNYTDAEAMEAAEIAARTEIIPVGSYRLTAHFVHVKLEHLWAWRADEQGSRIKHIFLDPKRTFITFEAGPGPPRVIEGVEMPKNALMCHSAGKAFYDRSQGEAHWGAISIPTDEISLFGSVARRCLAPPRNTVITIPPPQGLQRFHRLHASAAALAERAPQVIARPEAARALQQALIETIIGCLDGSQSENQKWAQQCHSIIMRRFRRLLEDHPDRALYVPEICAAIAVPERTLRLCCQQHLGMSPKQYLILRRMNLARRALLASAPGERTVTDIATSFGFWHFGRFSTVSRSLFNELPSQSLNRIVIPVGTSADWYARGVGGAAARETKTQYRSADGLAGIKLGMIDKAPISASPMTILPIGTALARPSRQQARLNRMELTPLDPITLFARGNEEHRPAQAQHPAAGEGHSDTSHDQACRFGVGAHHGSAPQQAQKRGREGAGRCLDLRRASR
ncbi:MAG: AraC family transcriptional regulator [Acetobacteraceae bacterium]|nr:AraC family transcriptional regulator [Acetobacteraceae bacterium]